MNDPNKPKWLSVKRFQSMTWPGSVPIAGLVWLLLSLSLPAQSTIQFQTRLFTVAETAGQVILPVVRLNDLETDMAVEFYSVQATATAGQDFTAVSGTLSFAAGVTNQTIIVPILNDALVEGLERFQVALTNATGGAALGSMRVATVSIQDNDTGPYFASATQQVAEDAGTVQIQVNWVIDVDEPQTVDYTTIDGTALAGTDYEAASGTVVFEAGERFEQIPVLILNDGVKDPDKSFQLQLSNASSGGLGNPSLTTVIIQDPTPVIFTQPTPASQSVSLGANVEILVSARGAGMQWQKRVGAGEFSEIPGATGQVLEWSAATVDLTGEYRFVVSDSTGETVISQIAMVSVDATFVRIDEGPGGTMADGSCGVACADYDGNGYPDLFISNVLESGSCRNSFWHNNGDGTFAQISTTPPALDSGGWWYAYWTDYDNDGDPDLHVLAAVSDRDRFYRNDENGVFTPVTPEFVTPTSYGEACSWADFDNDGWLDVFIPRNNGNDLMFWGGSDGSFHSTTTNEVGAVVGSPSYMVGASFDYDGDGAQDLLVAPLSFSGGMNYCRLYHNDGSGFFRHIMEGALANQPSQFDASTFVNYAAGDYDNDGDFDLMVTAGEDGYRGRLYQNDGNGTFTNVAAMAGVDAPLNGYSPRWADFDNDGDLDLLIMGATYWNPSHVLGNGNVMFRNNGDGTFNSIEIGSPLHDGVRRCSLTWVDYDNDGFLDLFMANGNAVAERNYLYRNNLAVGNANHWVKVRLVGRASNSMGVGAKVRVTATIDGKPVQQLREITTPGSMTQEGFLAHFGLGDATKVDTLRIEWPSGIVQELKDVAVDQTLPVVESQGLILPEPLSIQTFELDATGVFHATVNCPVEGAVCVLESSSNLERWRKVQVGTSSGGAVDLQDVHAGDSPGKFYRVLVP